MENSKYTIDILLLYLENKLPQQEAEEISCYLSQNYDVLEYVLKLSQINAYDQMKKHYVSFTFTEQGLIDRVSTSIKCLQKQQLAFRGTPQVYKSDYQFFDFFFNIITHVNNTCTFFASANPNFYVEIVQDDCSFLLRNSLSTEIEVSLESHKEYYVFISNSSGEKYVFTIYIN